MNKTNKTKNVYNSSDLDKNILNNAKYIISYFSDNDKEITNLKIQKLLYFLEAIYMVVSDEKSLFNENFYAWNFGPVSDAVYEQYKNFGRTPIVLEEKVMIPKYNLVYIKILFDLFANYTSYQLVALSHLPSSPWHDIYVKYGENDIPNNEIIEKEKTKIWFRENVVNIDEEGC